VIENLDIALSVEEDEGRTQGFRNHFFYTLRKRKYTVKNYWKSLPQKIFWAHFFIFSNYLIVVKVISH
jgi:hypothetical protein